MNISAEIYAGLSAPERIRATVSAQARNDEAELQTLIKTCPKRTYLKNESAYCDRMERLMETALAVEYDLLALALDCTTAMDRDRPEAADSAIVSLASVEAAWREALAEMGIPWLEMSEAGPRRHHVVKTLLLFGEGEENADEIQTYLEHFRTCLGTC